MNKMLETLHNEKVVPQ